MSPLFALHRGEKMAVVKAVSKRVAPAAKIA
jgi:hypothetical protein